MNTRYVGTMMALAMAGMSACSEPLSKRETGALGGGALGAGAGAIIGSQQGHAGTGAAIGGALGALSGAVLGDQAQKQDQAQAKTQQQLEAQQQQIARNQELIDELKRRNLDARETERGVVVNLPDILFEFGRADLTRDARDKVRDIADIVNNRAAGRRLSVEGHTDAIGSVEYNQQLSEQRAYAVASALEDNGVNADRLREKGFGKSSPVAPNRNPDGSDNAEGRARNRRVEVVILN